MLRVTAGADPLAREDLAFALSVVLLGLLMMVTRRNAVSQVVGFMSLENGLILAADRRQGHAAGGRDQRRLLGPDRLHRDRHLPVPHPRALRHGRRRRRSSCSGASAHDRARPRSRVAAVLVIPAAAAALLALAARLPAAAPAQRRRHRCSPSSPRSPLFAARPAAGQLPARRRPQRRLHRAQHLRRLHDQRVQRQLHRPRAGDRPADAAATCASTTRCTRS